MTSTSVKCGMCNDQLAKYKCPRCSIQTCCLKCCQRHKEESSCNGQRDKTAYVPIEKFNEMNFMSDYRMMEEMDRSLWQYQKNTIVKRRKRPHYQTRLAKEAHNRGVKLRFLPDGFIKRKENSTIYVFSLKSILWHLEWKFTKVNQNITMTKKHEKSLFGDLLKEYLTSPKASPLLWKDYRDDIGELNLLVQIEKTKAKGALYKRLDPAKSITDNLKGLILLEYPTIYVVTPGEMADYKVEGEEMSSSGDSSEQTSSSDDNDSSESESEDEEPPCKKIKEMNKDESSSDIAVENHGQTTCRIPEETAPDNTCTTNEDNVSVQVDTKFADEELGNVSAIGDGNNLEKGSVTECSNIVQSSGSDT